MKRQEERQEKKTKEKKRKRKKFCFTRLSTRDHCPQRNLVTRSLLYALTVEDLGMRLPSVNKVLIEPTRFAYSSSKTQQMSM